MSEYENKIIESAKNNTIWINGTHAINPTNEYLQNIGRTIINMLNQKENLIVDPDLEKLGCTTQELIVRINKL